MDKPRYDQRAKEHQEDDVAYYLPTMRRQRVLQHGDQVRSRSRDHSAVLLLQDILQCPLPHRRAERHGGAQVTGRRVVGAMRAPSAVWRGGLVRGCLWWCPWLLRWHRANPRPGRRYGS